MGNLIKETPYSEITATLEVLDKLGVERKHLHLIRTDTGQAERVAKVIRSWPPLVCKHCGSERLEPDPGGDEFYADAASRGTPYLCRDCADREDLKRRGIVRLFVDYAKPLSEMIQAGHYGYVNSDITEKHFSVNRRPNAKVEMKVFHFNQAMESDQVISEMAKQGYRPAELPEALAYAKANPDEQRKYLIVILGSVWRHWYGGRSVPYLHEWLGERNLCLGWFAGEWSSDCRFLAVRKS